MAVSERKGLKQTVVVFVKGVRTASMCLGIGSSLIDSYTILYLKAWAARLYFKYPMDSTQLHSIVASFSNVWDLFYHIAGIATMDVLRVLVCLVRNLQGLWDGWLFYLFCWYFYEILHDDDDEHCEMTCPSCDMICAFVDQSRCLHFQYFHLLYPLATGLIHIKQISVWG